MSHLARMNWAAEKRIMSPTILTESPEFLLEGLVSAWSEGLEINHLVFNLWSLFILSRLRNPSSVQRDDCIVGLIVWQFWGDPDSFFKTDQLHHALQIVLSVPLVNKLGLG